MTGNIPLNLRNKINSMAASRKSEIAMEIQKTQPIDNHNSRVLLSINSIFHNRLSEENLAVAIASKMPGVRYLPNSIHRSSERDRSLLGVFVSKNRRTMSVEQASAEGFTQVSDTVFQDTNDDIWTVIKNGDTAYLVQQANEDITSLLGAVRSRALATASIEVAMAEDYSRGNPILFYDFDKEELAFGIAIDGANAFVPDQDVIKEVPAETVVSVMDKEVVAVNETEVAASKSDGKGDILEFMRLQYSHNKEFLAEINNIIRNHVSI